MALEVKNIPFSEFIAYPEREAGLRTTPLVHHEPGINTDLDEKEIYNSLEDFYSRLNDSYDGGVSGVDSLARVYQKPGSYLPRGKFVLSRPFNVRNEITVKNQEQTFGFTPDGSFGFLLGYRLDEGPDLFLVGTTFSFERRLSEYFNILDAPPAGFQEPHSAISPVILQMQAVKVYEDAHLRKEARPEAKYLWKSVLESLRWEFALVELVKSWASEQNLPSVSILPARYNAWVNMKMENFTYQRAHMRYDVTARRCGFKQDDRGYYVLNLATSNSI